MNIKDELENGKEILYINKEAVINEGYKISFKKLKEDYINMGFSCDTEE